MIISTLCKSRLLSISLSMLVAGAAGAQSAASYPNKPVHWVVPFEAGSGSDGVTRVFSDRFTKDLGQPFVIENRSGASGIIGTTAVAKSAPDGYTMLVHTGMFLVNHWLRPDLPFDSLKDFTPVSMLARGDWMLGVNPAFPANNMKEFIAYAKANPGKINMSTTGSIGAVMYQLLMSTTGTKVTLVNYKGGSQPMTDLVSGRIDGALAGVQNLGRLVTSGKVKGLASAGTKRSPAIPNVPTFTEAGLKDFDPHAWWALIALSKTPPDIIQKLNATARKVQDNPEAVEVLAKQLNTPYPMTTAQAEQFFRAEAGRLGKLIKDAGIKPEDD